MANELRERAKALVAKGKGIFAADAGPDTLGKRFAAMGIEVSDVETRRKYREIILTTKGLGQYIGGVILHDETIRQKTSDGVEFTSVLKEEGILVGIKVDKGYKDLALYPGEKIAEGLDGLRERLAEYVNLGAKFTKWRAVINIGEGAPTRAGVAANAWTLARYAGLAQEAGLVPVVEPEILMEGPHLIERCAEVTEMVGRVVFDILLEMRVDVGGMLYKPNMVVAGKDCSTQPTDNEIAIKTVEVMKKIAPMDLPGIVFLSGGQEAVAATRRLNEIARTGAGSPWRWSFSFERALEGPAMEVWRGDKENAGVVQKSLLKRAKMNGLASEGKYSEEAENEV